MAHLCKKIDKIIAAGKDSWNQYLQTQKSYLQAGDFPMEAENRIADF